MSYERMKKRRGGTESRGRSHAGGRREAADAQEDETFGKDKARDEMPDWVGDKEKGW